MPADFTERLRHIQRQQNSVLCVGLDPDPDRLPPHLRARHSLPDAIARFNAALIEATTHVACAFKLNFAFYEALGAEGWRALTQTIQHIPADHIVIADAKRADIGNSARFYARSIFDELGCDACTVAPYMGHDSVTPFLQQAGRAAFVLARTSNPGAADFQSCMCDDTPLYLQVGWQVAAWSAATKGTGGLVAGATDVESLTALRQTCPDLPFLIPGVGAQGGDATAVMEAAARDDAPVLVNSSRGIIYASDDEDFAEAAANAAESLCATLNAARSTA